MTATDTYTETTVFLDTALDIGKYLAKEAIWLEDRCNWTGHEVVPLGKTFQTVIKATESNYYGGLAGISLFLTELYKRTNNPIIYKTLLGALRSLEFQFAHTKEIGQWGFYSGMMGIGCTIHKIGSLLNDSALKEGGLKIVRSIDNKPILEHELDVISGVSGAIPALLKIYREEHDAFFLQMAIKAGNFLLQKAVESPDGLTWNTMEGSFKPLTGYSHGASGVALALLELYTATSNIEYWHAALAGFKYEDGLYDMQEKNWPDFRQFDGTGKPNFGNGWCHGAPGIALARLRAYQITGVKEFLQQATIAMDTTFQLTSNLLMSSNGSNYSLCHGVAGNADIVLEGSKYIGNPTYGQLVNQIAVAGIEKYKNTNTTWPSGVNDPSGLTAGNEETPGLMLGLAGTGHFYLRLSDPTLETVLRPA